MAAYRHVDGMLAPLELQGVRGAMAESCGAGRTPLRVRRALPRGIARKTLKATAKRRQLIFLTNRFDQFEHLNGFIWREPINVVNHNEEPTIRFFQQFGYMLMLCGDIILGW